MFSYQESRGPVEVAFTDRHGGVSDGPYASLNLAEPRGDDPPGHGQSPGQSPGQSLGQSLGQCPGQVERNLEIVASALAAGASPVAVGATALAPPRVVRMRQVHGADVHTVDAATLARGYAEPPVADALVTREPGVALLVRVADCVPVLLADVDRGVIGAVHAGRPGLVAGVVPAAVERMRALGADRIVAWLGPHVCGRCYEVPAGMRAEVTRVVPESYAETSWGTPAVDVGAGVAAQLRAAGAEVVDAARCTLEEEDLFSYRRQGAASGRLGGLVWVRP